MATIFERWDSAKTALINPWNVIEEKPDFPEVCKRGGPCLCGRFRRNHSNGSEKDRDVWMLRGPEPVRCPG